jgi:hypothetical protein
MSFTRAALPRRAARLVICTSIALNLACQEPAVVEGGVQQVTEADRIELPPESREFTSPSGAYTFVVSTPDNWQSLRGQGELTSTADGNRVVLWSHGLPQQFGPRFALVDDQGTVVMFDEWINISTPHAIWLVDRAGRDIARHSTDAVQSVLQVPMDEVVKLARHGWWIAAPPNLDAAGEAALVETAGKTLSVQLSSGTLAIR